MSTKSKSIDVSDIDVRSLREKPFPAHRRYRISIAQEAHEYMWNHAETSGTNREIGGVLVGDIFRDEHGPYLRITAAIAAEHAQHADTQITFTFETWEHINRVKDQKYSKEKIVGWYHTHPSFGIFLSEQDVFIQNGFFYHPWQTAFVLDPVQKTEGFFIWSQSKPILMDEYWVDDVRKDSSSLPSSTPLVTPSDLAGRESEPSSPVSRANFAVTATIGLILLLILAGYIYLREARHRQMDDYIMAALQLQHDELASTLLSLEVLKKNIEQTTASQATIRGQIEIMQNNITDTISRTNGLQRNVENQRRQLDNLRKRIAPDTQPSSGNDATPPEGGN